MELLNYQVSLNGLKDIGKGFIDQHDWRQWAEDGGSVWIVVNLVNCHIEQTLVKWPLQELMHCLK